MVMLHSFVLKLGYLPGYYLLRGFTTIPSFWIFVLLTDDVFAVSFYKVTRLVHFLFLFCY